MRKSEDDRTITRGHLSTFTMDAVQHRVDFNALTIRHIIEPSSNSITFVRELRNIVALIAAAYVLSTAIGTFRDRPRAKPTTT